MFFFFCCFCDVLSPDLSIFVNLSATGAVFHSSLGEESEGEEERGTRGERMKGAR